MNMQRIRALQNVIGQQRYGSPNSVPAISQVRQQGQVLSGQLGAGFGKMPAIQALRQKLFAGQAGPQQPPAAPSQPWPGFRPSPAYGGVAGMPGSNTNPMYQSGSMKQPVAPTRPGPNMGGQGIPAQVTGVEPAQSPGVEALRRNLGPAAGEGQGGGGSNHFRHFNAGNWAQPHQSTPFENWRKGTVRA